MIVFIIHFISLSLSIRKDHRFLLLIFHAAFASIFNGFFGLLLAWVLVRYDFPSKRLLDALVDLPFALPTAVAGITLATPYSANGPFGAVIFLAGNMPYIREITSLMIFVKLQEFAFAGASAIASVVLMASLLLLLAINIGQGRYLRRIHGK